MVDNLPSNDLRGLRPPPWEERERFGFVNAFLLTIRMVLLEPGRLFRSMPVGLGLLQPVLFAAVMALVSAVLDWMWGLTLGGLPAVIDPDLGRLVRNPWFGAGQFLLGPPVVVAMVFVRAGVFHGILVLLGGSRLGFEGTLRVVAYARAARVLSLLPICGGLVGAIWELAVTIVGLARIHGCEDWKPVVAVVAPVLLAAVAWGGWLVTIIGIAALQ